MVTYIFSLEFFFQVQVGPKAVSGKIDLKFLN